MAQDVAEILLEITKETRRVADAALMASTTTANTVEKVLIPLVNQVNDNTAQIDRAKGAIRATSIIFGSALTLLGLIIAYIGVTR